MTTILLLLAAADDWFETRVRPVFATHCLGCHGKTAMGNLRLDQRESAARVIVAGQPGESLLVQAVRRTHARVKMPPAGPLPPDQVEAIAEWVRQGAVWPAAVVAPAPAKEHWAFAPLAPGKASGVDAFIDARLKSARVTPARRADDLTWLRRVTLDLTGLPPTPEEIDAFRRSPSRTPVVDRLLASPHFGERYGRYWLDLARYSDGQLAAGADTPLENAWRYRDWVVDAFNRDLPYEQFVRQQIAGPGPGLGFQALGANAHDQVDTTTKVFLGLTAGCAQCHDHKYDPIPTRDYYSLYGIFTSSETFKEPLVSAAEVKLYEERKKRVDEIKETLDEFLVTQQKLLVDTLARRTADYLLAATKGVKSAGLDDETIRRWQTYLKAEREHDHLKPFTDALAAQADEATLRRLARDYQKFVLELLDEAKEIDDRNYVAFGGKKGAKDERTRQYTNIVALPVLKFYQWRELANGPYNIDGFRAPAGVYYYGPKEIDRWLTGFAREHVHQLRAETRALEKEVPPAYPYLHSVRDRAKPADAKIHVRGDARTPGDPAPRRFLSCLTSGEPERITQGSGRAELANAIARHPLTARVIVNRIWQWHFGEGLVRTPSNFGRMGEAPSHPELLDWLAARLRDSGGSLKAIHREIVLSEAYARSSASTAALDQADPDNKLLGRYRARPRLDLEALRDSLLATSGQLDRAAGGKPQAWSDQSRRRTLYATVSRTRPEPGMTLFDFPDANASADARPLTVGPLQGLFFLNSGFVTSCAKALEARLARDAGAETGDRIRHAYRLLFTREPDDAELALGREAVSGGAPGVWTRYLHALYATAEFAALP